MSPPHGTILRFPAPSSRVPWVYGYPRLVSRDLQSVHVMFGLPSLYACLLLWPSHCRGGIPGALFSHVALPLTVEVYQSLPYRSPSYVGRMGSLTHLASPETSLVSSTSNHSPHYVYLALQVSAGFSPLQYAVDAGVHRVSLALLHKCDHVALSSRPYCDAI